MKAQRYKRSHQRERFLLVSQTVERKTKGALLIIGIEPLYPLSHLADLLIGFGL